MSLTSATRVATEEFGIAELKRCSTQTPGTVAKETPLKQKGGWRGTVHRSKGARSLRGNGRCGESGEHTGPTVFNKICLAETFLL
jgi:hypothetical protein